MSFFDYFRKKPSTATLAKDRLSIIVARERAGTRPGVADYLPQLQQELLAVIARYEKIDLSSVTVNLDRTAGCEVLELNIVLPEPKGQGTGVGHGAPVTASRTISRVLRAARGHELPTRRSVFRVLSSKRRLPLPSGCPRRDPRGPVSTKNPRVDAFVRRAKSWRGEIQKLRSILLDCGLEEDLKWGKPCFLFEGRNVAIIQPFKAHCSLMFFKGALLQDTHRLLRTQGENTQSAKRLEFTSEAQVKMSVVKSYVQQAIAVEQAGLKVDFKAKRELQLPEELTRMLQKNPRLAKAFHALTPGRRRGYVLHFAAAKQAKTRTARIEKSMPKILAGVGLNES